MSSPIPARTPFLDARGFVSWPWLKWLQELAGPGSPGGGGAGGGGGPINSSIDDAVLLAATHHQESSTKPNTEFGAADALDVLRTERRPSDDTAFFITQGRILREMIDQDARMMLAMLSSPRRAAAAVVGAGPASIADFVDNEVPSGAIDGVNVTFVLAFTPTPATSLELYQNGLLLVEGLHYTLAGATITTSVAPSVGDNLVAFYRKTAFNFADNETPAGTIDGVNVTFTLAHSPSPTGSLQLYQNGLLLIQGTHYTLAGSTITLSVAPSVGDNLDAYYRY